MQEGFLIVGRGLGQVMFQNNAVSGLLMLVGIACNSWLLALLALLYNRENETYNFSKRNVQFSHFFAPCFTIV